MRLITIPKPIVVKTTKSIKEVEQNEVHFKGWTQNLIDYYSEGVKTLKQVRQVQKIVEAIEKAEETLKLEDADWELLEGAVKAYPTKMAPGVVRQHFPFVDAILNAQVIEA